MNPTNIPSKDKLDALVKGLTGLEPIAAELSRDPVHLQSPHIGSVLGRIRGALDALEWHAKILAALPAPAKPQPSKVSDAKAGTPGN